MIPLALVLALAAADPQTEGAPPTTTTTTTPAPTAATAKLMVLREDFAQLACVKVIESAPAIEDHRLATLDERLEATFRHAYCLVFVGNISDASALFAAIVKEKVDANPPFEVEPRVQILLEAARAEEVKRQLDAAAETRRKLVERVTLKVHPPLHITGGNRAIFNVDVGDPESIVRSLRVDFRKRPPARASSSDVVVAAVGPGEFYALPVVKQSDGTWRGEIPGTYTRSKTGLVMEWFISASDDKGGFIKSVGTRDAPETLEVSPGSAMALDLKANERLTHEARIALASLGAPFLTTVMSFAGVAAATFLGTLGGEALTIALIALLPPVGATFGTWLVSGSLLDGVDALVPVLTTAGFGVVYAIGVVIAVADVEKLGLKDLGETALEDDGVALALSAAFLGLLSSAVVPTVLVALDAPEE
ncbi:MAG: hypothetical protein Q8O67_19980 [Deltaproteobacteria bacterium]|nr:hypothetical protein [Deltaproteobacteria bacterium]